MKTKNVLISEGAKLLKGFAGYLFLDKKGKREIYAPDGGGGYYFRNTIDIQKV